MNLNPNFENIQNICRMCLKSGKINIWTCRIPVNQDPEINDFEFPAENSTEKSFVEIMNMFVDSQDLLNLTEEFPLLCQQCLEDLKYCHLVYEKIKVANMQLMNLFQETLNECIEEEHLIDITEENEFKSVVETNLTEMLAENINFPQYVINNGDEVTTKLNQSKHINLDKNDSFIITQFIPETLEVTETCIENDDKEFHSTQNLLTVNLKAVEVQNIDTIESPQFLNDNTTESAIYVCQYCPQAFAKSEYLKTHIQKSHVCKFCTQPFSVTEDLFSHIRETHTEHKCAICQKLLSSGTNLRHHIRRVHRIKLPPKVTLIDFIKSPSVEESKQASEMEVLQEIGTAELEPSTAYSWKSDDSIEMLTEDNNSEID